MHPTSLCPSGAARKVGTEGPFEDHTKTAARIQRVYVHGASMLVQGMYLEASGAFELSCWLCPGRNHKFAEALNLNLKP